jgi:hypothetical protein
VTDSTQLRLLRYYVLGLAVFGLFWWPLSHWLYPDSYHDLLGFTGPVDDSMVKVIGTIGVVPILGLFLIARDPLRNRDFVATLLVFYALMAATYVYLINAQDFPAGEYVNVGLLTANFVTLGLLYPWRRAAAVARLPAG